MTSKYIPPALRNKEAPTEVQEPTPVISSRNSAFSRPRKQGNSSYWASRYREEDAAAKRESEAAAQRENESLKFNETNFPSIINVRPKTSGWSGVKFSEIAAQAAEEFPVEKSSTSVKTDGFELPVFPNFRRRTQVISPEEEQEYYEDQYQENDKLNTMNPPNDEESWVEVRAKIKIRKEKTLEEKFPEPEETVWNEQEEESCWDDRGRKLRH